MMFEWSMRNGAVILFALSLILALGAIIVALVMYSDSQTAIANGARVEFGHVSLISLLQALISWLGWAAIPFTGGALLWRIDRWNSMRAEAAE